MQGYCRIFFKRLQVLKGSIVFDELQKIKDESQKIKLESEALKQKLENLKNSLKNIGSANNSNVGNVNAGNGNVGNTGDSNPILPPNVPTTQGNNKYLVWN